MKRNEIFIHKINSSRVKVISTSYNITLVFCYKTETNQLRVSCTYIELTFLKKANSK